MPAPVWQNWCWQWGLQQAGEQLLKTVLTRLRQHKLPASTADMAAAHLHAMALAQLRGHTLPLRTDWLDAIAGSLIKEALNAPLPWSYRGVIHPDTDPILLTLIDTLAGDGFGKLAPSTPQPPLPKDVTCELERTAISLPAELTLNRFNPNGLAQSQVLHRLAILEILWIVRQQGSTLTLAGNGEEHWKLTRPLSQHAALIEAACFGATLREAARHKLEADMLDAGGIGSITTCLSQAALAGLASFSQQLLEQLTLLIAQKINLPKWAVRWKCYMPYGGWMKLAVCKARRYYKRRYARLSIARCGCVNLTADRMKRSFTLTCIAGKRFAIFCAIYIAALIYPAFRFLRR